MGFLSGVGLTATSIMVAIVQLRLVLEFLPKEFAGIWLLFLSLSAYIAFFDLGVSPTLSREISFALGNGGLADKTRHQNIADLLSTCFRIFSILAVVVFLLGAFAGIAFLVTVSPSGGSHEIEIAWIIFLSGASINLLGGGVFAALYGLGNISTERIIRAVIQVFGLGASYLCLHSGFGIIGLSTAWTLQTLLGRVVATIALYRNNPWLRSVCGKPHKELFSKLVRPSLKWASMGLGTLLILQTDKIIIASKLGPASIPPYEAVIKIALSLITFAVLIVNTTTPVISRFYAAGDTLAVEKILLRNVRISMGTIIIFGTFLAVFGKEVIDMWLGSGHFIGYPVLWTVLAMAFLEVHHSALAAGTMATGRLAFTWVAIVAGLLNVFIALILVKYLGLWGVALGTMIAQILTNNWVAPVITLKHFGISWKRYWKFVIAPVLIVLVICMASNIILYRLFVGVLTFFNMLAALVFATAFGGMAFYQIMLTRDERIKIRARIVS